MSGFKLGLAERGLVLALSVFNSLVSRLFYKARAARTSSSRAARGESYFVGVVALTTAV
jgi:hypothetical protein